MSGRGNDARYTVTVREDNVSYETKIHAKLGWGGFSADVEAQGELLTRRQPSNRSSGRHEY